MRGDVGWIRPILGIPRPPKRRRIGSRVRFRVGPPVPTVREPKRPAARQCAGSMNTPIFRIPQGRRLACREPVERKVNFDSTKLLRLTHRDHSSSTPRPLLPSGLHAHRQVNFDPVVLCFGAVRGLGFRDGCRVRSASNRAGGTKKKASVALRPIRLGAGRREGVVSRLIRQGLFFWRSWLAVHSARAALVGGEPDFRTGFWTGDKRRPYGRFWQGPGLRRAAEVRTGNWFEIDCGAATRARPTSGPGLGPRWTRAVGCGRGLVSLAGGIRAVSRSHGTNASGGRLRIPPGTAGAWPGDARRPRRRG